MKRLEVSIIVDSKNVSSNTGLPMSFNHTRHCTQRHKSTGGPVSTETGDRVRVQFPVPDIYFGM